MTTPSQDAKLVSVVDAMSKRLTQRFKAGPPKKAHHEPGQMHVDGWDWWDKFWKSSDHKSPDDKKAKDDLFKDEPPERKAIAEAIHGLSDKGLKDYADARRWTNFSGQHHKKGDDDDGPSVDEGEQIAKDVVRKEFKTRGIVVHI